MMMIRHISLALLFLPLVATASAQQRRCNTRLKKTFPSVYITFARFGKAAPVSEGESGDRIWLRLHNNTRWAIWLEAYGLPNKYGQAGMFYDLMSGNEMLPESEHCHTCSVIPLASGKTLLFSVPREHLSEGRALRIHFSFDWQDRDDVTADRDVDNIVSFFARNLPKEAR
jgi:hypothetical protein